jgi:hypothetical protein
VAGDRTSSLCWSHRYIWLDHHHRPTDAQGELNFMVSVDPPPGSTVASLRLAADNMVRRHEGLRTTYDLTGPVQRVHPPGPMPVEVYDTAVLDRSAVAAAIQQFTTRPFQIEREWPIRGLIVTTNGVPTRIVVVGHHVSVDNWSQERFIQEFGALHTAILSGQPANLPSVRTHPVDLAHFEASAEAAPTNQRAVEYWDGELSRIPADVFAFRRERQPGEPVAHSGSLSSVAARDAAYTLAARYGTFPSMIYTAAFTALLAAYTGSTRSVYRTYAANRSADRHPNLVMCMFQPVLLHVDCSDDPPFAEVVRRTAARCWEALANSYSAYDETVELAARHAYERGIGIRTGASINVLRHPEKARGGRRTIFTWNAAPWKLSSLEDSFNVRMSEWQDCVLVTVHGNSMVVGRDDLERFVRAFETVLLEQVDGVDDMRISDIAKLAGFDPWPGGADQVDLRQVAECLAEYPSVRAAKTFVELTTDGRELLTAWVSSTDPELTAAILRTHFLGRMYDLDRVRCPDRFVICRQSPADSDRIDSWRTLPVVDEGDGRAVPDIAPRTEAERLLAAAVAEANGPVAGSLANSYVTAGGRVLNIPRLRRILHDHGWESPTLYEIASARPLVAIARMMTPLAD